MTCKYSRHVYSYVFFMLPEIQLYSNTLRYARDEKTRRERKKKNRTRCEEELSSRFRKLWPVTKLDSRQWCIASCRWPVFHGWVFFFLLFCFSSSSSRTASSYFCFPTSLVECVASALTHCQKERGLSQWQACMYRGEEEEEDEEERKEEEGNDNDDEEETITIEESLSAGA